MAGLFPAIAAGKNSRRVVDIKKILSKAVKLITIPVILPTGQAD